MESRRTLGLKSISGSFGSSMWHTVIHDIFRKSPFRKDPAINCIFSNQHVHRKRVAFIGLGNYITSSLHRKYYKAWIKR